MIAGMNTDVPYKSNSLTRAFHPSEETACLSGAVKKMAMTPMVMAPMGKLIRKHHLQVAITQ